MKSTEIIKLIAAGNIKESDIKNFLTLIDAPESLVCIKNAASSFAETAPFLNVHMGKSPVNPAKRLMAVAQAIIKIENAEEDVRRLKGIYTINPIYSALYVLSLSKDYIPSYAQLISFLLMARNNTLAKKLELSSAIYNACLAARRIRDNQAILQQLPVKPLNTEQYIDRLKMIRNSFDLTAKKRINSIIYLLKRSIIDEKDGIKRQGGGTRTSTTITPPGPLPNIKTVPPHSSPLRIRLRG